MKSIYRRLACGIVLTAFVLIGTVSAGAEKAASDTASDTTILAEDTDKAQTDEHGSSGKQILVCIGGSAVVIIAIICLLADNKKK